MPSPFDTCKPGDPPKLFGSPIPGGPPQYAECVCRDIHDLNGRVVRNECDWDVPAGAAGGGGTGSGGGLGGSITPPPQKQVGATAQRGCAGASCCGSGTRWNGTQCVASTSQIRVPSRATRSFNSARMLYG